MYIIKSLKKKPCPPRPSSFPPVALLGLQPNKKAPEWRPSWRTCCPLLAGRCGGSRAARCNSFEVTSTFLSRTHFPAFLFSQQSKHLKMCFSIQASHFYWSKLKLFQYELLCQLKGKHAVQGSLWALKPLLFLLYILLSYTAR